MPHPPTEIYPYDPERCPFTATWNVLGGRWKGILWWRLSRGLGRFTDLRRSIPQVTKKVLTQQLRELERDGIVRREVFPEVPPRVEYSLTDYGRTLAPVIDAICRWGGRHLETRAAVDGEAAGRAPSVGVRDLVGGG